MGHDGRFAAVGRPPGKQGVPQGPQRSGSIQPGAGKGVCGGAASSRRRARFLTPLTHVKKTKKLVLSAQDSDWKQFVTKIERIDNWADTQRLHRQEEKRREEQQKAEGGRRPYR
jgi:hypothetical protein